MPSTLLDVITGALTSLGQLGRGQTANASDAALGLRRAQLIMSQASTKRLFIGNVTQRQYNLQANVADYTIGPSGATFTAARPTFIESCQVNLPGTSYWAPVNILDKAKWDAIPNRAATDEVPTSVYPDYTFPNLTFHVHPKPIGTPAIRFGAWEQLQQFTSVFDELSLAPAYEEWLERELAVAMAPDYDQPVSQVLADALVAARQAVMAFNAQALGAAVTAAQRLESPNVGEPGAAG